MRLTGLLALAAIVVAGCTSLGHGNGGYRKVEFDSLPGWRHADLTPSLQAFLAGCPRLARSPLAGACDKAQRLPSLDEPTARQFFESTFTPYLVDFPAEESRPLVTGYYEPVLQGSRTQSAEYRYPIYGVPQDLVIVDLASVYPELKGKRLRGRLQGRRLVPYYSRGDIERGAGGFSAPVIAWARDPVALFFLQVQGSGQIRFDDGSRIRVGYADQNGYPYSSVGRALVARGELTLEQASMQGIKQWAAENPDKLESTLNLNASYVFFRELPASDDGPPGALNAPLSPGYSVAVDPRYVPLGAPVYLDTTYPGSQARLERLAAAQDTGGAIRGAGRADLFWGSGEGAGALAGAMRQQDTMWLLWPRGAPLPGES